MWSEQATGLALALSSSIFIGTSFIIKKRGLRVAGSTGLRAGTFQLPPFPASDLSPLAEFATAADSAHICIHLTAVCMRSQGLVGSHTCENQYGGQA
eukprot:jgi/Chrzof1/12894/Cz07g11110.t1